MPTIHFGMQEEEIAILNQRIENAKQPSNSRVFEFKGHYIKLTENSGTWSQSILTPEQVAQLNQQ